MAKKKFKPVSKIGSMGLKYKKSGTNNKKLFVEEVNDYIKDFNAKWSNSELPSDVKETFKGTISSEETFKEMEGYFQKKKCEGIMEQVRLDLANEKLTLLTDSEIKLGLSGYYREDLKTFLAEIKKSSAETLDEKKARVKEFFEKEAYFNNSKEFKDDLSVKIKSLAESTLMNYVPIAIKKHDKEANESKEKTLNFIKRIINSTKKTVKISRNSKNKIINAFELLKKSVKSHKNLATDKCITPLRTASMRLSKKDAELFKLIKKMNHDVPGKELKINTILIRECFSLIAKSETASTNENIGSYLSSIGADEARRKEWQKELKEQGKLKKQTGASRAVQGSTGKEEKIQAAAATPKVAEGSSQPGKEEKLKAAPPPPSRPQHKAPETPKVTEEPKKQEKKEKEKEKQPAQKVKLAAAPPAQKKITPATPKKPDTPPPPPPTTQTTPAAPSGSKVPPPPPKQGSLPPLPGSTPTGNVESKASAGGVRGSNPEAKTATADLMADIRKGFTLSSVSDRKVQSEQVPEAGKQDLTSLLAKTMANRRKDIADDNDFEEDDEDDWSD